MVSPGNNSGNSIFKGSDIEMGIIIRANVRIVVVKLNNSSAFFLNHFEETVCKKDKTIPAEMFKPIML
jgi:hypothetical protein